VKPAVTTSKQVTHHDGAPRSSKKFQTILALTAALGVATALSACSRDIEYRGYQARAQDIQQLRIGMTKTEVRSALGSPSTTATVKYQGDSFYYISSRIKTSAFLANEELDRQILAVRFDQFGQVQSFGQYTLEDGRIIDMNTRETPSRGRELSLLRQLFGNLGNFTPNDTGPPK
jgi:outer membrane protein assembly factor BamE (lipoprotein component of BamABCDE complex)